MWKRGRDKYYIILLHRLHRIKILPDFSYSPLCTKMRLYIRGSEHGWEHKRDVVWWGTKHRDVARNCNRLYHEWLIRSVIPFSSATLSPALIPLITLNAYTYIDADFTSCGFYRLFGQFSYNGGLPPINSVHYDTVYTHSYTLREAER